VSWSSVICTFPSSSTSPSPSMAKHSSHSFTSSYVNIQNYITKASSIYTTEYRRQSKCTV
jgi:hypothetical protein